MGSIVKDNDTLQRTLLNSVSKAEGTIYIKTACEAHFTSAACV